MSKQQIDDEYIRAFFGLEDDEKGRVELAEIKSKLEKIKFEQGQDICVIDGKPDGMFFLESGTVIVLDREGKQINIMHEGQYFGEYAVLAKQRRLSTVRSLGRTIVYKLENDDLMEILARHPDIYGELMKRVYDQVSAKHTQVLSLSRMHKGILTDPHNRVPMPPRKILLNYGAVALIFLLSFLLIPKNAAAPVFFIPLALMIVYALMTRRTLESLVVSGMLAALLLYRNGLTPSYADSLLSAMGSADNVFTVLVMALMGGMVTLIEASGAITAFKKLANRKVTTKRGAKLAALGILAVTAIDDGLNMLCASTSLRGAANEQRLPREDTSLMMSLLPTTLSSFFPFSLWGIFIIGSINPSYSGKGIELFCRSIPFNFFSLIVLAAMLAFCFGKLPLTKRLKAARSRVENGGKLWPDGSEKYLINEEGELWGKKRNLLLPIVALAVSSFTVKSIFAGSFIADSVCGLIFTLIFMFFLYCIQGIMSPEQFFENLMTGVEGMILPTVLYLLTMCLSSLLEHEAMGAVFDGAITLLLPLSKLFPAVLFLVSTLFTVALGSSWAMYVIGFPVAMKLGAALGLSLPLCIGAVCAAGLAGEKLCIFTDDQLSVANAVGCNPDDVLKVRMPYAAAFSVLSLVFYAAAGFIF